MGLMDDILGGQESRRRGGGGEYVELGIDDVDGPVTESTTKVHIARIADQRDVIDIKNAIYDGDIVVADITRHTTTDRTMERITKDLQELTHEVGGDIVQKADDQLIITPGSVSISRTKLGG
ncbi:MAG TPA: cell division protein SepF [Halococcus sp.]|nr:cell division protein SepF [Halococcus sp.]